MLTAVSSSRIRTTGFRFGRTEPVEAAVRRILREQIGEALRQLQRPPEEQGAAVHQARKALKRSRAVLRLARGSLAPAGFKAENRRLRDAGRLLASVRDADVQVETLQALMQRDGNGSAAAFAACYELLAQRRAEAWAQFDAARASCEQVLEEARTAFATLTLRAEGFAAIEAGLRQNYLLSRRRLVQSERSRRAEHLHDWRKRVKDFHSHVKLLQPLWPPVFAAYARALDVLAEHLGEDHNLHVLDVTLAELPEAQATPVRALIAQGRADHQAAAFPLGRKLFAERPAALVERVGTYWSVERGGV